ncbi:MAG: DNA (cytosine-5-)-methyltransferase [Verrucomicrobia bacterium]|nr:DNA (cytosine-5-)-methyltransferase [Verrucomicrobiota bacterium]
MDIELFAGAGGLALGFQAAGFFPSYLFEIDKHSCETMRKNHVSRGGILNGQVVEGDVREVNWSKYDDPVRLLTGGAPCQPFSLAGKHRANRDGRNLFPEVLRAIRALQPKAVVLENVQGLTRPSFRPYFEYIIRQLECPSIAPMKDELWEDHDARIMKRQRARKHRAEYNVAWSVMNAADYGVPQNRRRVFCVATRVGVLPPFHFPSPTHSRSALLADQSSGRYWKRHKIAPREVDMSANGKANGGSINGNNLKPWRTVRDALRDLRAPKQREGESENNHWLVPGARLYPGHGGSDLDWPSKTIKAGVHGVPGGENSLHLDDGTFRYFTLRETARIQGFPDNYIFTGARIHVTRQIGNAVPCSLATMVAAALMQLFTDANVHGDHAQKAEGGNQQ